MKFKNAIAEAVILDKKDNNYGGYITYPNGRKKHVKEEVYVHIINFVMETSKKGDRIIIPRYRFKKSKHIPLQGDIPKDEIYVTKNNYDMQYKSDIGDFKQPDKFASFDDFYKFIIKEYNNGNIWPLKLTRKMANEGSTIYHKKYGREINDTDNFIKQFKTLKDKLRESIKWLMITNKTKGAQQSVIIRKSPHIKTSYRYSPIELGTKGDRFLLQKSIVV